MNADIPASMLNPGAIGIDALTGGILDGMINRVFTGVYNPSPQLVSQYNTAQMLARQTINAKRQIARSKDDLAKGGSGAGHKSWKDLLGSGKTGDFSNIKGETIEEILSRIPEDAQMRVLKPVAGKVETGVEFSWKVGDKTIRARIHGIDHSAPSGSNAANGGIIRVQEGKKYLDPDTGIFQPPGISNADSPFYNPDLGNNTHIPIQTPGKEIIDELIGNN